MKPKNLRRLIAAAALFVTLAPLRALEPNEWRSRQPLAVERPGAIKVTLPPATLDAAQGQLEDLRLLDPAGRETPFVLQRPTILPPATIAEPATFRATLGDASTEVVLSKSTAQPIDVVTLLSPAANFIKPARVETSTDGRTWRVQREGAPFFRQFGVEQLRFEISDPAAMWVRITLDDSRSRPVPVTGARLSFPPGTDARERAPLPARIAQREEYAGETVFTLDLGARHVPLADLEFVTADPLFARNIRVTTRELRDDTAVERTLAIGAIYRVAVDGLAPSAHLQVPLDVTAPERELLVHVANLDSPPLAIDEIRVQQRPVSILFRANAAGTHVLLAGNPDATAPRYDLQALGLARDNTGWTNVAPGTLELNPSYRRADALANTPLFGAALDPAPWVYRKTVHLATAGVQQLELDLDVLAHAQPGFFDLRLVRDGAQVPYLLERPALSRSTPLAVTPANDPKRPSLSRWQLKLPRAGLPLTRLTLVSPTALFQRRLRLYETIPSDRGNGGYERTLGEADWSRTPNGPSSALTFALQPGVAPTTDTLTLETDNGDNPPLALASAQAAYPVMRLLFKTDFAPLALYYGNRDVAAPRYDLTLVAGQILAAEKNIATLEPEEKARADGWATGVLAGARGGVLFWSGLGLVVIVLLAVVAKLLPKPPAA